MFPFLRTLQFLAGPKPFLCEFGINHRLQSFRQPWFTQGYKKVQRILSEFTPVTVCRCVLLVLLASSSKPIITGFASSFKPQSSDSAIYAHYYTQKTPRMAVIHSAIAKIDCYSLCVFRALRESHCNSIISKLQIQGDCFVEKESTCQY